LPITLQNNGQVDLTNITLSSSVAVNGQLVSVQQIFSTKNFSKLSPGQQQNLNLSVYLNTSQDGTYEINVNADVQNPKYSDSGKAYITVQNGQVVGDQLSFAEQYILNNTACSNLTSLIDQAKNLYSQNNLPEAQQILANAIEQCKQAIQQVQVTAQQRPLSVSGRVFLYLIVGVILALVIGFGYYMFKQFKLNKIIDENDF